MSGSGIASASADSAARAPAPPVPWLFSRRVDLGVFLLPALAALALLAIGRAAGIGSGDAPEWTWIPGVLLVDVAHVWATLFPVYLDPVERRRHPWLYGLTPLAAWGIGIALHAAGPLLFWRALAYLAVFHFVRQQIGWVALYRARAGERDRRTAILDHAAIYAATLYPLLYWHAHLPRRFAWFLAGDFAALPDLQPLLATLSRIAGPLAAAILAAFAGHALWRRRHGLSGNPGKEILVATTAACWYAGIVATNSDYAFTVTNVLIHGIPYLALVYFYGRASSAAPSGSRTALGPRLLAAGLLPFLALLWSAAYAEELLWDHAVWHERPYLFGSLDALDASTWLTSWQAILVPLLAVPQITHYLLDGLIWRRAFNPRLRPALAAIRSGATR
jgi:hypothetical protein